MNTLDAYVTKILSVKPFIRENDGVVCMQAKVEYDCWGRSSETTILIRFGDELKIGYKFEV